MGSAIDRIKKRAFYPLALCNGETVHVRGLKMGELRAAQEFSNDDASIGFAIGLGLLEDDGRQVFEQIEGESPKDFGDRVLGLIDIGPDVQNQLVKKIFQVTNEPETVRAEAILKN
jgi:hypothetical protein